MWTGPQTHLQSLMWNNVVSFYFLSSAICPQKSLPKCSGWAWKISTGWRCGRGTSWRNKLDSSSPVWTRVENCQQQNLRPRRSVPLPCQRTCSRCPQTSKPNCLLDGSVSNRDCHTVVLCFSQSKWRRGLWLCTRVDTRQASVTRAAVLKHDEEDFGFALLIKLS